MSGPRDLNPTELGEYGLGVVQRRAPSVGPVTRVYCLRCGNQVAWERHEADPDGWWACARGCNAHFSPEASESTKRPQA